MGALDKTCRFATTDKTLNIRPENESSSKYSNQFHDRMDSNRTEPTPVPKDFRPSPQHPEHPMLIQYSAGRCIASFSHPIRLCEPSTKAASMTIRYNTKQTHPILQSPQQSKHHPETPRESGTTNDPSPPTKQA